MTLRTFLIALVCVIAGTVGVAGAAMYISNQPPDVVAGKVIQKWYTPAHDWTYMQPMYATSESCSGQPLTCSTTTVLTGFIPIPEHDDAYWSLKLRNASGRTGNVKVDETTYHAVALGDHYNARSKQ